MNQRRCSPYLVEWIVNAGSLQIGSNLVQKSVVLFRVGQRRVLVVSFNVCKQRPDNDKIRS